ncbi:hypothetical protein H4R21_000789 [Coemansia helicoidea]|uniref:Uncharacterized protein n=1 Tax=Coemansia helicoidea TaxID=1286919 RepID=A0ACC1LFL5_9FUNG|nr:hypothetical protein H4R21_000789 [Coemansia helicoidea]
MLSRACGVLRRAAAPASQLLPRRAFTVAIDGPAASGKSSTARAVAHELGFGYIDSGSIYRCAALLALRAGAVPGSGERSDVAGLVGRASIDIRTRLSPDHPAPGGTDTGRVVVPDVQVLLDGEDVSQAIRTPEINRLVAAIASDSAVRDTVLRIQQALAGAAETKSGAAPGGGSAPGGVVMDGRDIGTTVFPGAELKIYLDASAMARAIRRWDEMNRQMKDAKAKAPAASPEAGGAGGQDGPRAEGAAGQAPAEYPSVESIARELEERDYADINRKHSPLRIASDAVVIDNTSMTFERQVHAIVDLARERMGLPRKYDDDDL